MRRELVRRENRARNPVYLLLDTERLHMSSLTSPQRPNTDVKKVAILFSGGPAPAAPQAGGSAALAHAALQELGYSPAEINAALKGVDPNASTEDIVRHALRAMVMKG